MQTKPWWKSKTVWATLITALLGAYDVFHASYPTLPTVPPVAFAVLGALGLYGRVSATTGVK